jgi:ribose transport system substrate-binding protein
MEAEFKGAAEKLKKEGIISDYIMTNSNGDISTQINDVKDLITKDVDAIVITAASGTALAPVCEEAIEAGIIVIGFNELVVSDKMTSVIDQDNYEIGRIGAQWLADTLGGKGDIICLNGRAGTEVDRIRIEAYTDVFKNYPGIKILGTVQGNFDYATTKNAVQSLLVAHPKIDGVFSQGGAMTQGAIDAFVEAGRPLVPMVGESNNGFLKLWKRYRDKGFKTVVTNSPTYTSALALELAVAALQGKKVEHRVMLEIGTIKDEELDKYVREDLPDSYWAVNHLTEEQIQAIFK